jgi:hypothetical protein
MTQDSGHKIVLCTSWFLLCYLNHDCTLQKVHEYVKKKMDIWEAQVAPHMEKINWCWHPMIHIFNTRHHFCKQFYLSSHGHTT